MYAGRPLPDNLRDHMRNQMAYAAGYQKNQVSVTIGKEAAPGNIGADISKGIQSGMAIPGRTLAEAKEGRAYVPWGNYKQIELENVKTVVDQDTGEIAYYQRQGGVAGSKSENWVLIGGGGRNAAQSGAFTLNEPETPAVYRQYGRGVAFAETADIPRATEVLANPEGFSRLGAEAYGGFVLPIGSPTVKDARYSVFANKNNLANFANPQGPNIPKKDLPGARIPWTVSRDLPSLSYMNEKGLIGGDTIRITRTVAGQATVTESKSLSNIYDVYSARKAEFDALNKQWEAGGKTDVELGDRLQKMNTQLNVLKMGKFGAEVLMSDIKSRPEAYSPQKDSIVSVTQTETPAKSGFDFVTPLRQLAASSGFGPIAWGASEAYSSISAVSKGKTPDTGMFKDVGNQPSLGSVMKVYENSNIELSKYTTDVSGYGRKVIENPNAPSAIEPYLREPYRQTARDVRNVGAGFVTHPVDIAVGFAGGEMYAYGKYGLKAGIGKAAMAQSDVLFVKTAGKAFSTPLAGDVGTLAETGLGIYSISEAGKNIINQPSRGEQAVTAGRTIGGFAGFGAGVKTPNLQEPANPYLSRKLFGPQETFKYDGIDYIGGERAFSPLQKARMHTSAYMMSLSAPEEVRPAYRTSVNYFIENRFKTPIPGGTEANPKGTGFREPDISKAQTIGNRAPVIRDVLGQVGHITKGSVVMESQKTGLPTAKLFRGSKDLDVEVADLQKFEALLKQRGETTKGIDVKPFEQNYPNIPGVTGVGKEDPDAIRYSGFTRIIRGIFGEPIQEQPAVKLPAADEVLIGGKNYPGVINEEMMNVQFARKSQAFMQDLLPASAKAGNPAAREMNEMFRLPKDLYDRQIIGRDLTGAAQLRSGKPIDVGVNNKYLQIVEKTKFDFDFMPKEDNAVIGAKAGVHFKRTMTGEEIRLAYENSILGGKGAGGGSNLPPINSKPGIVQSIPSFASRSIMPSIPSFPTWKNNNPSNSVSPRSYLSIPSRPSPSSSPSSSKTPYSDISPSFSITPSITSIIPSIESRPPSSSTSTSTESNIYSWTSISSRMSSIQSPRSTRSSYFSYSPSYYFNEGPKFGTGLVAPLPFGGGGGGAGYKRRRWWMEEFRLGLDIGFFGNLTPKLRTRRKATKKKRR